MAHSIVSRQRPPILEYHGAPECRLEGIMAIHIDTTCTCGSSAVDDTCDICWGRHCPCLCDDCSDECLPDTVEEGA